MKNKLSIIAIILCCALLISCSANYADPVSSHSDAQSTEQSVSSPSSLASSQDGSNTYADSVAWDGFNSTDEPVGEGCAIRKGEWIYYTEFLRDTGVTTINLIKIDGSGKEVIFEGQYPHDPRSVMFEGQGSDIAFKNEYYLQIYEDNLYVTDWSIRSITDDESNTIYFDLNEGFPQKPKQVDIPDNIIDDIIAEVESITMDVYKYYESAYDADTEFIFTANGTYLHCGYLEMGNIPSVVYFKAKGEEEYKLFLEDIVHFDATDNHIAYTTYEDLQEPGKLYVADSDGSNQVELYDEFWNPSDFFMLYDSYLFYPDIDSDWYKYNIKTHQTTNINLSEETWFIYGELDDDGIYYFATDHGIYKMPIESDSPEKISSYCAESNFTIIDDWLFADDGVLSIKKMRKDGSDLQSMP